MVSNEEGTTSPVLLYWSTVMELVLLAFQFIRSLCEGNFNVYVHSLNQLARRS